MSLSREQFFSLHILTILSYEYFTPKLLFCIQNIILPLFIILLFLLGYSLNSERFRKTRLFQE